MKNPIGILQGRLTPPKGRGIQFFPAENWEQEFFDAREVGIKKIVFLFDLADYETNPVWTPEGRIRIKELIRETGVVVSYIGADFFMRQPFYRVSEESRRQNVKILEKLLDYAKELGAEGVEVPLLGNSSLETTEEKMVFVSALAGPLRRAEELGVNIAFEAELPPERFTSLLKELASPRVKVVYDTGNSAALGYNQHQEIVALRDYLSHLHVKDRVLGGSTVPLGTGNAKFDDIFRALKEIDFSGDFILQAARGEENKESETIRHQKQFVERYITEYLK